MASPERNRAVTWKPKTNTAKAIANLAAWQSVGYGFRSRLWVAVAGIGNNQTAQHYVNHLHRVCAVYIRKVYITVSRQQNFLSLCLSRWREHAFITPLLHADRHTGALVYVYVLVHRHLLCFLFSVSAVACVYTCLSFSNILLC